MALYNPPPPLLTTATNAASASNILYTPPHSSSYTNNNNNNNNNNNYSSTSTSSSIIIVIIVISSAIIVSASIYLLLRFFSRAVHSFPPQNDAVSNRFTDTETRQNSHDHVINFGTYNKLDIDTCSLPLFKFSSLPDTNAGGDCAVCLSKFEPVDQLRLLPMCCHAFHAQCIDAWLKTNLTCPLCRSTVIPTEDDVRNKTLAGETGGVGRNNSFRIEIGSLSRRRTPSDSGRRSYSIGSYEYVLDDGYEVPVESAHRSHRREVSDKDSVTPEVQESNLAAEIGGGGGSGRLNWLRDYVDRVSVSISSRSQSFRSSRRFFAGSSRRSEEYDGRVEKR
ncbi:E3 ubiquitin-protein ligase ATL4-like [Bidens hawaiensis]|uniref:E3 ubiquitin-protein ligase ATL4-like n=1 Tax=Bidens hawaiensis TaxID=980011 RepID=UPI004049F204